MANVNLEALTRKVKSEGTRCFLMQSYVTFLRKRKTLHLHEMLDPVLVRHLKSLDLGTQRLLTWRMEGWWYGPDSGKYHKGSLMREGKPGDLVFMFYKEEARIQKPVCAYPPLEIVDRLDQGDDCYLTMAVPEDIERYAIPWSRFLAAVNSLRVRKDREQASSLEKKLDKTQALGLLALFGPGSMAVSFMEDEVARQAAHRGASL